jgi:hypothetical protein
VFDTSGECLQYAQDFVVAHGYAIIIKWSKFITVNNTRELQVAYLHCNKSGEYHNCSGEENFEREIISWLTDCPFDATIWHQKEGHISLIFTHIGISTDQSLEILLL